MADRRQTRAALIDSLHRSRLEPYLNVSSGDEKLALSLYGWNLHLTSAFQELLSVVEVVLRNAMDAELQKWNNAELGASQSWLLEEPAAPLKSLSQGKRLQAIQNANKAMAKREQAHWRHGQAVTHDDVLAQITFGLWKDLLPNHKDNAANNRENQNRTRMWNEALVHAFPNEEDPDGETTFWRVFRLHGLRNRVSHMETLLEVDAAERARDVFALINSISRPAHDWLTGINRVPAVLKTRPST
ncbi:hypothetical protein [Arthrobacter sp. NyZ413]|uniref:hypothetical protein n=1 Tax=Arthrobacter sp. NyZ413 TaxID=3144669 RepID=UPI003BF8082A